MCIRDSLEENNILKEYLGEAKASAIITTNNSETTALLESLKISNIVVENPRIAFSEVLNKLYEQIIINPGIDDSSVINKTAKVKFTIGETEEKSPIEAADLISSDDLPKTRNKKTTPSIPSKAETIFVIFSEFIV